MKEYVMMEYIEETQESALHILENSQKLCESFGKALGEKKYGRILLAASGTSYNACVTVQPYMEKMLQIPCELATAYSLAHYKTGLCGARDLLIAVTQEGESTNTIDALKRANDLGIHNFVVTEDVENTCTQIAADKVTIDCGREFVGPKTKGYTCTVLTLLLMALEGARVLGYVNPDGYASHRARIHRVLSNINPVIEKSKLWFEAIREDFQKVEKCYVLGYGAYVGTAMEGALKSMETVRYPYFWFETEEFLHGPLASVKEDVYTLIIAPKMEGYERANLLFKAMKEQGYHVYSIGKQDGVEDPRILDGAFVDDEDYSILEYCVPLQLLAYLTYRSRGYDLNVREYPKVKEVLSTKARPLQR